MKVISIRQPWASLIINGYKEYEFRSWNTNFRGTVFIHASKNIEKNSLNRFKKLNLEYPTGKIIGRVKITDCIKMDSDFENKLISKNELVYGTSYNRTGYAFKLDDIKKIKEPIKANGQLGFWNYYDEFEVMNLLQNIEYGWIDKNKTKHHSICKQFDKNYILQSPKEVIKNKIGVCFDQVELERYYFKNNDWDIRTYFICYYTDNECSSHTFLTFKKDNFFYWFEHSWEKYKGINRYNTLKELLKDVKEKFILSEIKSNYNKNNLLIREYSKPNYHITTLEFYKHCEINKPINIDKL